MRGNTQMQGSAWQSTATKGRARQGKAHFKPLGNRRFMGCKNSSAEQRIATQRMASKRRALQFKATLQAHSNEWVSMVVYYSLNAMHRSAAQCRAAQSMAKLQLLINGVLKMDIVNVTDTLNKMGLLDYGQSFSREYFRELCGIVMPETGTAKDFENVALAELSAIGAIRDALLNQGKYLKKDGEAYRVLLPSENALQVQFMNQAAKRKINRARKLERNTPRDAEKKHVTATQTMDRFVNRSSRLNALFA